jgi:hypothetical protein
MNYCPQASYSVSIFGFLQECGWGTSSDMTPHHCIFDSHVLIQHSGLTFKDLNAHKESFVDLKILEGEITALSQNTENQMPRDASITPQKNSYLTLCLLVSTMIHLPTCIITLNVPLTGLNSLKRLRLQDNLIQQLPEEVLSDLKALEQLSLRKNHLSIIPPKLFSHLTQLKHLDLSNNWISSVLILTFEISTSRIVSPIHITENYSNRWLAQSNTGLVEVFSVRTSQELWSLHRPEMEWLDKLQIWYFT